MEEENFDLQVSPSNQKPPSEDCIIQFPLVSLATWTHKLGSKEFVESELARAFQSWTPYTNLKFVQVDVHKPTCLIRLLFGSASVFVKLKRYIGK